jgi:hypothetical protein
VEAVALSELTYLYGFVPADAPRPDGVAGMGGAPVHIWPVTGAGAAVSAVPADVYAAHAIEARLDDLDWVADQGAAHERVVSWFVDHTDIMPAALFTLYSSPDALLRDAAERAAAVAEALERLRGMREWDLKLSFETATIDAHLPAAAPALATLDAEIAAAAPGRRYLLERRRADLLRTERRRVLNEAADAMLAALRPCAADVVRVELPRVAADLPVIMHAALLVARNDEAELASRFETEAASAARIGLHAALSGPWAPYRFVGAAAGTAPPAESGAP